MALIFSAFGFFAVGPSHSLSVLSPKMSHIGTTYHFPPLDTPMNGDQLHPVSLSDSESLPSTFPHFSSNTTPSQPIGRAPLSFSSAPIVDALLIDNLAKDFLLEPVQRANLHAFIKVTGYHYWLL